MWRQCTCRISVHRLLMLHYQASEINGETTGDIWWLWRQISSTVFSTVQGGDLCGRGHRWHELWMLKAVKEIAWGCCVSKLALRSEGQRSWVDRIWSRDPSGSHLPKSLFLKFVIHLQLEYSWILMGYDNLLKTLPRKQGYLLFLLFQQPNWSFEPSVSTLSEAHVQSSRL